MGTIVCHRIGTKGEFTDPIEDILAHQGQITFDGVYTSVFDHRHLLAPKLPILFISGDQIGREGFCNTEQLLELKKLGFILGWHGWSHRKVTELSRTELWTELSKPTWVNDVYAYPHGDFDEQAMNMLKELGYKKAYSTTQGDENVFSLRRSYLG